MNHRTAPPRRVPPFQIGAWRVFPDLNRLSEGENSVSVEPRVMEVLVLLAERAGRVVTREDLLDAVWGDRVVNEEALTRAIWEIRQALGDDPRQPRYVETIRKGGYRLIVPVTFVEEPGLAAPGMRPDGETLPLGPEAGAHDRGGSRRRRFAPLLVPLLVLAALLGLRAWRPVPDEPAFLSGVPLTSLPGAEMDPALSPDGSRVAFSWNGGEGENVDIYVIQKGSATPLRLTEHPADDRFPAWSPEGSEIAFFRMGDEKGVYAVPSLGGPARLLLRVSYWIQGLDWSPDGKQIAFSGWVDRSRPTQIALLSLESGEVRPVTNPEARYSCDYWPRFSPDGGSIAFGRSGPVFQQDVYVAPSRGGAEKRITFLEGKVEGLAWARDGRGIVFGFARSTDYALYSAPLDGGGATPLAIKGKNTIRPAIARDGSLVYEERSIDRDIGCVRIGPEGEAVVDEKPLVASTKIDRTARFSPANGLIAFVSDRSGSSEIWISRADGSAARRATRFGGAHILGPFWSPDGRRIAFSAREGEGTAMYWMDAEGSAPIRVGGNHTQEIVTAWSRDGERLFYECWAEGGWEVRARSINGANDSAVLPHDGHIYGEGPDGRIVFFRFTGGGIWAAPSGGGEEECLVDPAAMSMWSGVTVGDGGAHFAMPAPGGDILGYLDFATGETRRVAKLPWSGVATISLSPDGSLLLFDFDRSIESDLVLVENFR